jgi:hypothetical protein
VISDKRSRRDKTRRGSEKDLRRRELAQRDCLLFGESRFSESDPALRREDGERELQREEEGLFHFLFFDSC